MSRIVGQLPTDMRAPRIGEIIPRMDDRIGQAMARVS